MRYIHQNPIKSGIVERAEQYNLRSYKEYVGSDQVVDTAFCLEQLSDDRERAKKSFIQYHQEENNNQCLDIEITQKNKTQDKEAQSIIKKVCKVRNAIDGTEL